MGYEPRTSWSQGVNSTAELQLLLNQMRRVKTTSANSLGWEIHDDLISKASRQSNLLSEEPLKYFWQTRWVVASLKIDWRKIVIDRFCWLGDFTRIQFKNLFIQLLTNILTNTQPMHAFVHARTHARTNLLKQRTYLSITAQHTHTPKRKQVNYTQQYSQKHKCTHFHSFEAHILMLFYNDYSLMGATYILSW